MSGYCWQPLYDALEEAGRDVRLALPKEVNTPPVASRPTLAGEEADQEQTQNDTQHPQRLC